MLRIFRSKKVFFILVPLILLIAGGAFYFFYLKHGSAFRASEVLAKGNPFGVQINPFRDVKTGAVKDNIKIASPSPTASAVSTQTAGQSAATQVSKSNSPGGCNSDAGCAIYCDKPEHMSECLDYAQKNGLISGDELSKARKVADALSRGVTTPGGCKTPQACKNYCTGDTHLLECVSFAVAAGIISVDEASQVNTMGEKIKNGGPGGCKTREECQAYCEQQIHGMECAQFFGPGSGPNAGGPPPPPGGSGAPPGVPQGAGPAPVAYCTTLEGCKAFCADPANAEKCKNVVISDQNATPAISGNIGALKANILEVPEEGQDCVKIAIGAESYNKIMAGEPPLSPINAEMLATCFEFGVQEHDRINTPTPVPETKSNDVPVVWDENLRTTVPVVQGASTRVSIIDLILGIFK